MILQYRTQIMPDKVHWLHDEDFREPEILECFISWNCRIPLKEYGLTELYIDIQSVDIQYKRYLGNPNHEDIVLSDDVEFKWWDKPNCRTRFIDGSPTPTILPIEVWIGHENDECVVKQIEFSK